MVTHSVHAGLLSNIRPPEEAVVRDPSILLAFSPGSVAKYNGHTCIIEGLSSVRIIDLYKEKPRTYYITCCYDLHDAENPSIRYTQIPQKNIYGRMDPITKEQAKNGLHTLLTEEAFRQYDQECWNWFVTSRVKETITTLEQAVLKGERILPFPSKETLQ